MPGRGNQPDFNLVVSPRPTEEGRKRTWMVVGVAWRSGRGEGIRIKLNAGVSLTWRDLDPAFGGDLDLFLFPSNHGVQEETSDAAEG